MNKALGISNTSQVATTPLISKSTVLATAKVNFAVMIFENNHDELCELKLPISVVAINNMPKLYNLWP